MELKESHGEELKSNSNESPGESGTCQPVPTEGPQKIKEQLSHQSYICPHTGRCHLRKKSRQRERLAGHQSNFIQERLYTTHYMIKLKYKLNELKFIFSQLITKWRCDNESER